ncbi:hypothetical protein AMST5_01479 [freshwater sediment metagenome]|uniref:Uncharacterized protein n=1 Tax=freshwater sediment metagenome TaxID=556182 RepID=A0AA48M2Q3_9ZZZZ
MNFPAMTPPNPSPIRGGWPREAGSGGVRPHHSHSGDTPPVALRAPPSPQGGGMGTARLSLHLKTRRSRGRHAAMTPPNPSPLRGGWPREAGSGGVRPHHGHSGDTPPVALRAPPSPQGGGMGTARLSFHLKTHRSRGRHAAMTPPNPSPLRGGWPREAGSGGVRPHHSHSGDTPPVALRAPPSPQGGGMGTARLSFHLKARTSE